MKRQIKKLLTKATAFLKVLFIKKKKKDFVPPDDYYPLF